MEQAGDKFGQQVRAGWAAENPAPQGQYMDGVQKAVREEWEREQKQAKELQAKPEPEKPKERPGPNIDR